MPTGLALCDSTYLTTGSPPPGFGGVPALFTSLAPLFFFFFVGIPSTRSNPAVLGVFIGSGLEKGAGGPGVVHGGGPMQRGFSPFISGPHICLGCNQFFNQVFHRQPGGQHQRCGPILCPCIHCGLSAAE